MTIPNEVLEAPSAQPQPITPDVPQPQGAKPPGRNGLGRDMRWVVGGVAVLALVGVVSFVATTSQGDSDDSGSLTAIGDELVVEPTGDSPDQVDSAETDPAGSEVASETEGEVPPVEPAIAETDIADPEVVEPEVAEPEVAEPEAVEPEVAEPEAVEPEVDAVVDAETETPAPPPASVPDASSDAEVPESKATVRNGQIFLEGAVPTQEEGDALAALAAEILGPDNVFNDYVVDPRADDASLGNVTVEDTINFRTNSSVVLPESEGLLNQGLALLTIRPAMTITIVGHTDSRGSVTGNQELSLDRAEAVKQWFVDRGVAADRLFAEGAGSSEPIADNATTEGQQLNRRIQFFLQNILG